LQIACAILNGQICVISRFSASREVACGDEFNLFLHDTPGQIG
jgi:hypothetical protein